MKEQPKIDNAPGHVWKPRKVGWELRWCARTDKVKQDGYPIKSARIWKGTEAELTELAVKFIQDRCNALQNDMLAWGCVGEPVHLEFDGTLNGLMACYRSDKASPWVIPGALRFVTKQNYSSLMRRLEKDCGDDRVENFKARNVKILHAGWSAGGKVSMGHAMVGMLRVLMNFGASILEDDQCERVANVLHRMKFPQGKPRSVTLNYLPVAAICARARARGRLSIALAQAMQFDFTWRQKDCIGEWVPMSELGLSTTISGNNKWLRGLRWEELDGAGKITHITSKRLKEVEIDLRNAPLVLAELEANYPGSIVRNATTGHVTIDRGLLPASGPVVVSETTGLPYEDNTFRREWRSIAHECGVPKNVRNMDSRAGAITEAFQSGARPEAIQKSATHSTMAMTGRYNRNDAADIAETMQSRVAGRNKPGK